MNKFVGSSPAILRLLNKTVSETRKRISYLVYEEAHNWASLKSTRTNRIVAYFQPLKSRLRIFPKYFEDDIDIPGDMLRAAPISSGLIESHPMMFVMWSEKSMEGAIELINKAYEYDLKENG